MYVYVSGKASYEYEENQESLKAVDSREKEHCKPSMCWNSVPLYTVTLYVLSENIHGGLYL